MKTWIIISLTLVLISFVFMICAYFGIIRYFKLQMTSSESYAKIYNKLEKASKNKRVVISLSITPEDVHKMEPIISSILDQTVKVNEIALNVPPDTTYIPKYLQKYTRVYKLEKDYGPSNNLIPTLVREKEKNTLIIALDNDVLYGKDYIGELVDRYENLNSKYNFPENIILFNNQDSDGVINGPFVVNAGAFEPSIIDMFNESDTLFYDPELWMTAHLNKNTVKEKFTYIENFRGYTSVRRNVIERKNKRYEALKEMEQRGVILQALKGG
jgi:hypothetical protein